MSEGEEKGSSAVKGTASEPRTGTVKCPKKQIADQRRQLDGKSAECRILKDRESEIKKQINDAQSEFSDYERRVFSEPFSKFRVLASSIKRYELLYDVDLILHITSGDSNTMDDIYNHAYDITSLGRSEDFVELKSVDKVTLTECEEELTSEYSAYVALENVRKKRICTKYSGFHSNVIGTKYVVPKMYVIGEDGRRIFDKKRCYTRRSIRFVKLRGRMASLLTGRRTAGITL